MGRPRLTLAVTWPKFETAVLEVFEEGLRRLALRPKLPRTEEPINFELYRICLDVHLEYLKVGQASVKTFPFIIDFDSTNQPVLDDVVRSKRLRKRPDFACVMLNPQASEGRTSQIRYCLECKRLGAPEGQWILNENYSERGQLRFVQEGHGYGKGCDSAAMIGYVQNMDPDSILSDVNQFATARKLPSLRRAATEWATTGVTRLNQSPITRDFDTTPVTLRHLWADLRHCEFESTQDTASAPRKKTTKKKATTASKNKPK